MSTSTPKRRAILEALVTRVQDITVAHGYRTDAGALVFLGEKPDLGPDDPSVAVAVVPSEDSVTGQGDKLFVELPIEFQALAKADIDAPHLAIEDVLADLKEAIETADRTLGGLAGGELTRTATRTMDREPGATTVGVALTYMVPYREQWGHPES